MIRKGITLLETMFVLIIGIVISMPFALTHENSERDWQKVKHEFQQKYLLKQQQVNLGYFSEFTIRGWQQSIYIGDEEVVLPADWQACNYGNIRWQKSYVTAGTIRFMNIKTREKASLIFQLGGGTYRFTT